MMDKDVDFQVENTELIVTREFWVAMSHFMEICKSLVLYDCFGWFFLQFSKLNTSFRN